MKVPLPVALLCLLLAGAARAEWVDWVVDADLAARYDANVNRASVRSEEASDLSFHPSVTLGRFFQLAEQTRILAAAELGSEMFSHYEDLDALTADVEISLLHKLGLGDAPWLRPFVRGGYQEVADDHRSGPRLRAGLVVGKRLSPRLDATLRYAFTRRYGEDGPTAVAGESDAVFDQQFHQIALGASLLLTEDLLLSADFTYHRGDFDSNAQESRFDLLGDVDLEAVAEDEAFDGWVYRVDGDAYAPSLRLNQALGDHWSLDLGYRFQYGDAGGLRYRNHVASALVLFRY